MSPGSDPRSRRRWGRNLATHLRAWLRPVVDRRDGHVERARDLPIPGRASENGRIGLAIAVVVRGNRLVGTQSEWDAVIAGFRGLYIPTYE